MAWSEAAAELVRVHGPRAAQVVADHLVAAVRAGDEAKIVEWDRVMRELDAMTQGHRFRPQD